MHQITYLFRMADGNKYIVKNNSKQLEKVPSLFRVLRHANEVIRSNGPGSDSAVSIIKSDYASADVELISRILSWSMSPNVTLDFLTETYQ